MPHLSFMKAGVNLQTIMQLSHYYVKGINNVYIQTERHIDAIVCIDSSLENKMNAIPVDFDTIKNKVGMHAVFAITGKQFKLDIYNAETQLETHVIANESERKLIGLMLEQMAVDIKIDPKNFFE